jgi:hypothetical protein
VTAGSPHQAFGEGEEGNQIKAPERLDTARTEYEAALTATEPILQWQAHEGLAAIAKYKGEKDAICTHAQEAIRPPSRASSRCERRGRKETRA